MLISIQVSLSNMGAQFSKYLYFHCYTGKDQPQIIINNSKSANEKTRATKSAVVVCISSKYLIRLINWVDINYRIKTLVVTIRIKMFYFYNKS